MSPDTADMAARLRKAFERGRRGLLPRLKRGMFRLVRRLQGRDDCEVCDGTQGARGNENLVDVLGCEVTMCDYCTAKWFR